MTIQQIHEEINKLCPIYGITINGEYCNKKNWYISFREECTLEQKQLAVVYINNLDVSNISI